MEKTKRPRPQLSCTPCKSRKLKCDRASPCAQCIKAKRTTECSLPQVSGPIDVEARPVKRSRQNTEETTHRPQEHDPRVSDLLLRVEALERALSASTSTVINIENVTERPRRLDVNSDVAVHETETSSSQPVTPLPASLNVNGARVRYQGGSHRYALIEQFTEVQEFIPKAIKDPKLAEALRGLQKLRKSRTVKLDINRRTICTTEDELKSKIISLLPDPTKRELCLDGYFKYWETVYRIVHTEHFQDAFQVDSYQHAGIPICSDLPYLLQTILMIAIGYRTGPPEFDSHSDMTNDVCALVQGYLDTCSSKARQEFSTLQTRTLLVLLFQVCLVPVPKLWIETGNLIRHAMSMGLHRDASEAQGISPYMGELRRRLWTTILEFDIHTSLVYGMPMAISNLDMTCKFPHSVQDKDLRTDCSMDDVLEASDRSSATPIQSKLAFNRQKRMRAVQMLANRADRRDNVEIKGLCEHFKDVLQTHASHETSLGESLRVAHIFQLYLQLQQTILARAIGLQVTKESLNDVSATLVSLKEIHGQAFRPAVGLSSTASANETVDSTAKMTLLAISRRAILQASLMRCLCLKYIMENRPKRQADRPDINEHITVLEDILKAFIDILPRIDVKDILLLAIAVQFLKNYDKKGDTLQATIMDELWVYIRRCTEALELSPDVGSKVARSSDGLGTQLHGHGHDVVATTPQSFTTSITDSLLGPLDDIGFADLGFGYLDDWQEEGGLAW